MSSQSSCTKVLFVCLGNICRSPAAEGVFKGLVDQTGLKDSYEIDSCGTGGGVKGWYREGRSSFHEGNPADHRMMTAAANRNIAITSRSRPMRSSDLDYFDLIIAMDSANKAAISEAAHYWGKSQLLEPKLKSMTSYCKKLKIQYVPDPYYDGMDGFENVLDILEDACEGLLEATKGY